MLKLAPRALIFNFPSREGGSNLKEGAYLKGGAYFVFKFEPQHYFVFISSEDKLALNSKSGSSLSAEIQICVRDTYMYNFTL